MLLEWFRSIGLQNVKRERIQEIPEKVCTLPGNLRWHIIDTAD